MLTFFYTLGSGTSIKNSFTLVSDTVSESVACGGSGSIILMVSAIFNNEFLVGSPDYNKLRSGRWGTEECDDIICH